VSDAPEPASSSLAAMQRWILDALVHPERVEAAEVERRLVPGPRLGAAERLAIYQRSYVLRLLQCLAEQFPALCHALGRPLFDDFAREYLCEHPSDSYTLYALGRRLPAWLEASRPDRERPPEAREDWIDFMVDLASYERELFGLFDAPGHEGAPWPSLEIDDAQLVLQPCFALAEHRYPVAWYYHEVRAGRGPVFPPRRTSYVAIARRDYLTSTFPLSALQYGFLRALERTGSVPRALAEVAASEGRPLADVERSWSTEVRRAWIEAGLFVAHEQ
jgi:Putative DNA-binding domain